MISDSPHQPLYLRASNIAQAPEDDEFWPALQDRMASHINEDATAANGHGQELDEPVFADLMAYDHDGGYKAGREAARQQGDGPWLQGFASLYDALAMKNDGDAAATLPDLVRVVSSDPETETETESDDESSFSSSSKRGVSFSSTVEVKTIPHRSSLPLSQRQRMYASPVETRRNKKRNKKEFRYDGCDWRNATEECDMGVDAVTGELVHPAHELS